MTAALVLTLAAVTIGIVLIARALGADGPWDPKP